MYVKAEKLKLGDGDGGRVGRRHSAGRLTGSGGIPLPDEMKLRNILMDDSNRGGGARSGGGCDGVGDAQWRSSGDLGLGNRFDFGFGRG